MNPENYGSREACERLFKAGIVLETEKVWALNEWPITVDNHVVYKEEWQLIDRPMIGYKQQIPALSMAEVWRELPNATAFHHDNGQTEVWCEDANGNAMTDSFADTNPTDALIDLLIWVRKEAP